MAKCPYCGGDVELPRDVKLVPTEQLNNSQQMARAVRGRAMRAFHSSAHWARGDGEEWNPVDSEGNPAAPAQQAPLSLWERIFGRRGSETPDTDTTWRPSRAPTVESDVTVPLLSSSITGGISAACTLCLWILVEGAKPFGVAGGVGLAAFYVNWLKERGELRSLMWTIEKIAHRDIDKDGHEGKPPPRQPAGRLVIQPKQDPLPHSWFELDAAQQQNDIYHFARIVWERQQRGENSNGQKALRGTQLPSGFEVNDGVHKAILDDLDRAGVIRWKGSGWELAAPPAAVRNRIRAEEW